MIKKAAVLALKKLDGGSSVAIRLVKMTGKHQGAVHPKHLIDSKLWFEQYLKKRDVVLDLGCGHGQTALRIAKKVKSVVGAEINEALLEIGWQSIRNLRTKNIVLMKMDANKKFPFKDGYFDKVLCSDVLEHLDQRTKAISEINRVLEKGGMLMLVTDNPNTSWKKLQRSVGVFYYADLDHKYEYPLAEIKKLLAGKGFEVKSVETSTYDTPFRGLIDLSGGISLDLYKKLRGWREEMNRRHPEETTGYRIVAVKK